MKKERMIGRKFLSFVACVAMVASAAGTVFAATTCKLSVVHDQTGARQLAQAINGVRADNGMEPLKFDYGLEKETIKRTIEKSLDINSSMDSIDEKWMSLTELYAVNTNYSNVIDHFVNDPRNQAYHDEILGEAHKAVAVAHTKVESVDMWIVELSDDDSVADAPATNADDSTESIDWDYSGAKLTASFSGTTTGSLVTAYLDIDLDMPSIHPKLRSNANPALEKELDEGSYSVEAASRDNNIVKLSGGKIVPVSRGKTSIDVKVRFDGMETTAKFDVNVRKEGSKFSFTIESVTADPIPDQEYTGSQIKPQGTIRYLGTALVEGRDYTVIYGENISGTGTVTFKGCGSCKDTKTVNFNIKGGSAKPTGTPTGNPDPTAVPTSSDKPTPTLKPGRKPTATPTLKPGQKPTVTPTLKPGQKPTATPTLKPGQKPTATPTLKPGQKPTATPKPGQKPTGTPSADPRSDILEFVKRIYIYVLDREPEAEGSEFWSEELYSFRRTGAEVGLGFIGSDEFIKRNTTDDEFVTVLYNTFFGREPEENGFKFWTDALHNGQLSREQVANGFVYSQEWADTCARYGIRSGGDIKPSVEIAPTDATYSFVERMYTTAMKRASDEDGKKFWASELANFRFTGEQVGAMFFLSDEMNGFKLSNKEFVTRLYKTFMDRDPEKGGFDFWVNYLNDGGSREGAVYGFTRSEEFVNKCIEARILPY